MGCKGGVVIMYRFDVLLAENVRLSVFEAFPIGWRPCQTKPKLPIFLKNHPFSTISAKWWNPKPH